MNGTVPGAASPELSPGVFAHSGKGAIDPRASAALRVLVIGYGNPARQDDGLGVALAERLERLGLVNVSIEMDYQLSIEHAALVAAHDVVVFADASVHCAAQFSFAPIAAAGEDAFCTHAVMPGQVLRLAATCFGATPRAYLLGLRARVLDGFGEGLTAEAQAALEAGLAHLVGFIEAETSRAA